MERKVEEQNVSLFQKLIHNCGQVLGTKLHPLPLEWTSTEKCTLDGYEPSNMIPNSNSSGGLLDWDTHFAMKTQCGTTVGSLDFKASLDITASTSFFAICMGQNALIILM